MRCPARIVICTLASLATLCVSCARFPKSQTSGSNPKPATAPEILTNIYHPTMLSLDGEWHFQTDPINAGEKEQWFKPGSITQRTVLAPLPWQLACPDLREYLGAAWYERTFNLPQQTGGKRVVIHFESVDFQSKVWINGQPVGEHKMDCTPFEFEITPHIRFGAANTVTVRAYDDKHQRPWTSEQSIEVSGMRGQAWVEVRGPAMINDIHVISDVDRQTAKAIIEINAPPNSGTKPAAVHVTFTAPDGTTLEDELKTSSLPAPNQSNTTSASLEMMIPNPMLWDLEHPNLYKARVAILDQSGATIDEATTWFGMRKLETRGDQFYLNNHPIYISGGWIDQSPTHGPDQVNWAYPPPYKPLSNEQLIKAIQQSKDLNIVAMRRIFQPVDSRLAYWADRMGILIRCGGPWVSANYPDKQTPPEALTVNQHNWRDLIRRHRNSPSMALYDLFTENAGLASGDPERVVRVEKTMYDYVRALDPSSLLLDNACGRTLGGYHGATDYHDFNDGDSCAWVNDWDWMRNAIKGYRSYGKPLTSSLTSNLTPRIVNVDKARKLWGGKNPWWFTTPPGIDTYSSYLTDFDKRYTKWGLDKFYGDWTSHTEATDWAQFYGLKYHAEQRRLNPQIAGFYGFLFDCIPHFIGIIDPFLDKKVFADQAALIYAQDVIIPDALTRNYWSGESVQIPIYFSHYSTEPVISGKATWHVEGDDNLRGEIASNIEIRPGEVQLIGAVNFRAPEVTQSRLLKIHFQIEARGKILTRNFEEVRVFPISAQRVAPAAKRVNFANFDVYPENSTRDLGVDYFRQLGYEPHAGLDPAIPVAVARGMNADVDKYVQNGGTAILLAYTTDHDFLSTRGLTMTTVNFSGGINGALFVRKTPGLFERIPFDNPITWPFYKALPTSMLVGINPKNNADILAGGYGGFMRCQPGDVKTGVPVPSEITATLLQCRYGKGRLIVCTFDLLTNLIRDPAATIMLNDLVQYAGGNFSPAIRLK